MQVLLKMAKGFALLLLILFVVFSGGCSVYFGIKNCRAKKQLSEVHVLQKGDFLYRDLNKNGTLDIYEDKREPTEARIDDILGQMTLEEKVGLMWQPQTGVGNKGQILGMPSIKSRSLNSTWDEILNKNINHFNIGVIPNSLYLAEWSNRVQKIAEQTRLGIPVTISTDPRHGIYNFMGNEFRGGKWSKWPEPIGLAAIGDSLLVVEFGKIVNAEYRAVGIRQALHPMADLATEPRWSRISGTFGEDAALSAKLVAAYIYGLQGDSLNNKSVACMTKHWPGGGPQENGEDPHFDYGAKQVYPGNNFSYHLIPFEAALKANTASIMPYYGIPSGQTNEEVGMSFNNEIIRVLLREKYGYDGVVCTDWGIVDGFRFMGFEIVGAKKWGVENLSVKERIKKAVGAGVDQFGGNDNTEEMIDLVNDGQLNEERIDESVRRLLRMKFELGLFDDPYVDAVKVEAIVNNPESIKKGEIAQRKSIVLLKNSKTSDSTAILPLPRGVKIYTENIDENSAQEYGLLVDKPEEADFAILRLNAPFQKRDGDLVEKQFHQGSLEFSKEELNRIAKIASTKPTIVCVYLDRPAILSKINADCKALLCDFGAEDDAFLDIVFGDYSPVAKLPIELPSSMEAVENQLEDIPYDSENPLFPFGYGLTYSK